MKVDIFNTDRKYDVIYAISKSVKQIVLAPRGRHSEKPAEVRKRIETLRGEGAERIELFARQSPEGWDVWGNEV